MSYTAPTETDGQFYAFTRPSSVRRHQEPHASLTMLGNRHGNYPAAGRGSSLGGCLQFFSFVMMCFPLTTASPREKYVPAQTCSAAVVKSVFWAHNSAGATLSPHHSEGQRSQEEECTGGVRQNWGPRGQIYLPGCPAACLAAEGRARMTNILPHLRFTGTR